MKQLAPQDIYALGTGFLAVWFIDLGLLCALLFLRWCIDCAEDWLDNRASESELLRDYVAVEGNDEPTGQLLPKVAR